MLVTLVLATLFAVSGALINHSALMQVLFRTADKEVLIEASNVNPRGTFFELRQGSRKLIDKRAISIRPIKLSQFKKHEFSADLKVVAYYSVEEDPANLDVLLLVDLESNAYSVYWGGCRADKCLKQKWKFWDNQQKRFKKYLGQLKSTSQADADRD